MESMKYKFGDSVITLDGQIGIVTIVHQFTQEYFVAFPKGGRLFKEDELKEWHGCW